MPKEPPPITGFRPAPTDRPSRCPVCGGRHEPPENAGFRVDWALLLGAVIVATAIAGGGLIYGLWLLSTA